MATLHPASAAATASNRDLEPDHHRLRLGQLLLELLGGGFPLDAATACAVLRELNRHRLVNMIGRLAVARLAVLRTGTPTGRLRISFGVPFEKGAA